MSNAPEDFKDRVERSIAAHGMLHPHDTVLAAVSGGPDSMALLDVLRELGYPLEIAHFDHQTRAGASALDAQFVRQAAEDLRMPFHLGTAAVEREAQGLGKSFEQHARDRRYAWIEQTARERGCTAIATGHHADDVAETVLLRLVRGATPGGLAGVPPVRELGGGLRLVRPMIDCTRAQALAWLEASGLPAREDESNRDVRFLRNRIRHDLLPRLRHDYNPQTDAALVRLAEAARIENDYLYRMGEKAFGKVVDGRGGLDRDRFRGLHEALRRRVLLLYAWKCKVDLSFERVVDAVEFVLRGATGQQFDLGGGWMLYNGRTHTEAVGEPHARDTSSVPLAVPGVTEAFGLRFAVRLLEQPPEQPLAEYCTPLKQVFDADVLGTAIAVRHRNDGDRFAPLGLGGSKKLQDYFVDAGVPVPARDVVPLVVCGGAIAWIAGHAVSDVASVRVETKRWLEIEVTPCD